MDLRAFYEAEFAPGYTRDAMPSEQQRIANAAEYSAAQLGKISRNLARLVDILEKRNGQ
jgi:hypothetical protein